jgi:putative peptidoglycan lipid II flippase
MQARVLSRRIGGLDGRRIVSSVGRMVAAAAAMGGLVWAVSAALERLLDPEGTLEQAIALAIPVTVGVVTYIGFANLFGVEELDYARSLVTRRFARK